MIEVQPRAYTFQRGTMYVRLTAIGPGVGRLPLGEVAVLTPRDSGTAGELSAAEHLQLHADCLARVRERLSAVTELVEVAWHSCSNLPAYRLLIDGRVYFAASPSAANGALWWSAADPEGIRWAPSLARAVWDALQEAGEDCDGVAP